MFGHVGEDSIVLFLGSKNGSSQLVNLPTALLHAILQPTDQAPLLKQSSSSLQQRASVHVQQPSILDSAAPILDAIAFEEPKGERMLVE